MSAIAECPILAVLPWRRFAVNNLARADKLTAIDVLYEVDNIAAFAANTAVPNFLGHIDAKPISAAAFRARTVPLDLAV